jgi:hypothetical protein
MYNIERNTFLTEVSSNVFMMLQQEPVFIAVKGLSSTKIRKVILLIGSKYGKKIYVIENLSSIDYGMKLSYVCGHTRDLDLTWVRKGLFLGVLYSKLSSKLM